MVCNDKLCSGPGPTGHVIFWSSHSVINSYLSKTYHCQRQRQSKVTKRSRKEVRGLAEPNPWPKFKTERRILLRSKTLPIQNELYINRTECTVPGTDLKKGIGFFTSTGLNLFTWKTAWLLDEWALALVWPDVRRLFPWVISFNTSWTAKYEQMNNLSSNCSGEGTQINYYRYQLCLHLLYIWST